MVKIPMLQVYDVTYFAPEHPGGVAILAYGGRDASDVFAAFHAAETWSQLAKYCIGEVEVRFLARHMRPQRAQMISALKTQHPVCGVVGSRAACHALRCYSVLADQRKQTTWNAVLSGLAHQEAIMALTERALPVDAVAEDMRNPPSVVRHSIHSAWSTFVHVHGECRQQPQYAGCKDRPHAPELPAHANTDDSCWFVQKQQILLCVEADFAPRHVFHCSSCTSSWRSHLDGNLCVSFHSRACMAAVRLACSRLPPSPGVPESSPE
jgi:Cytochrome b5-like Heme/Steroid binding domain